MFPENKITDRGEYFWHRHPAKQLLAEDVRNGLAYELKPELLRATNLAYQEFNLSTFRKHIYQEKEKQRAEPYWRHKRNIDAMIQLVKDREVNKKNWMETRLRNEIEQAANVLGGVELL